ncbi:methyltransferase [Streptomyces sp. NPDC005805]|uniref:methyltransferase n=1 Tax=Streptomyces sp. NPDC005805 TaxID=3157068 RepID=UPI0033E426A2
MKNSDTGYRTVDVAAASDLMLPYAIRVAATLRLADLIASGTSRLEDLAQASDTHIDTLGRLLRFLTCRGIFTEPVPGFFAVNEAAQPLQDDHPGRLRLMLDLSEASGRMNLALTDLLETVRTGEAAYPRMFGRTLWDDFNHNPALGASFDRIMANLTAAVAPAVANVLKKASARHIADVGGGNGVLLETIVREHPLLRGTLVELPNAAGAARARFAASNLAGRLEVIEADFFDQMPPKADIYLLSAILHGLSDDNAVRLLTRCAEAVGNNGSVLVIDELLTQDNQPWVTAMDLQLLVFVGGRLRTLEHLEELAAAASMNVRTVHQLPANRSLLECVPTAAPRHQARK